MHVLIAPNALKGSLDAAATARAIARGFERGLPGCRTTELPIADGGDGTADVLARGLSGTMHEETVLDALGRSTRARWAELPNGSAVLDVASASGLGSLASHERDPLSATSYGTGELVRHALSRGCRTIVLGVGGSATVDGGSGVLEALGVRLLDENGERVARGGAGLSAVREIDTSSLCAEARDPAFSLTVLCDVTNPLLGADGAARVFGPQKGADERTVAELELGLTNLARVIERQTGCDVRALARGGAAGGISAALHGVLGARLVDGIDHVLEVLDFDRLVHTADVVVTAEGFLDQQTLGNKGPYGVARAAKRAGKPVIALAGGLEDGLDCIDCIDAAFSIVSRPMDLATAMQRASELVETAAARLARALRVGAEVRKDA
jgi:glycerate kinase